MNATEDGMEPVGEAPELPLAQYDPEVAEYLAWLCKWPETPVGYSLTEPGHIENIPVLGENERQAIAEIRALHVPVLDMCDEYVCGDCGGHPPCPTIDILEKRGL